MSAYILMNNSFLDELMKMFYMSVKKFGLYYG